MRPEGDPAAPAKDMEDIDRGTARERTELAWIRTALAFAALGGAVLKVDPALGIPVLAASALVWAIGRFARHTAGEGRSARRAPLLLITIAVILVSIVALVAALLGGGALPPVRYGGAVSPGASTARAA
jgi:uncharacterized membrane protein YidH (DUF202 family)